MSPISSRNRGPHPHRLHRVGDAAVAGDHHHRDARGAPLQLAQDVDPGPVGQPQVEEDRRRVPLGEEPEPLPHGGGAQHPIAAGLQHLPGDLPDAFVVVDDEEEGPIGILHG
jgi:hypothetical protein